jgi:hypothetical protein
MDNSRKSFEIFLFIDSSGSKYRYSKVSQPFWIFENRTLFYYDFLYQGAHDVKWDHMISKDSQFHASVWSFQENIQYDNMLSW